MISARIARLASALALAACAAACSQPAQVQGVSWQITNVYTTPEYPSEVPDSIAGIASITFGGSSFTGSTGCARFQGIADYDTKDPSEASEFRSQKVEFEPIDDASCTGHARFIHDHLVAMLSDATFDIDTEQEGSVKVLTQQIDQFQRPGFRLQAP